MLSGENIKKIESLSKKLQIASDKTRLRILCYIFDTKKACVSDIAKDLNMSVAIISHHLQALSKEGLLDKDREGKMICYYLAQADFMDDLKTFICKYK